MQFSNWIRFGFILHANAFAFFFFFSFFLQIYVTKFFRDAMGDSNFTERKSRRSAAGVLGVDCTSDGSDLYWPVSVDEIARRTGCGVPLGDQIPNEIQHLDECFLFLFLNLKSKRTILSTMVHSMLEHFIEDYVRNELKI